MEPASHTFAELVSDQDRQAAFVNSRVVWSRRFNWTGWLIVTTWGSGCLGPQFQIVAEQFVAAAGAARAEHVVGTGDCIDGYWPRNR
jgi:hypothetical protein